MLVYDLETDGLRGELTRVHCLNILNRATGEKLRFNRGHYDDGSPCHRDGPIEDGVRMLEQAECIGGHNIIRFDNPVLAELYGFNPRPDQKVRDSMVEARVIWTNIWDIDDAALRKGKRPDWFVSSGLKGTHKLEAWGARLGVLKGEFKGPWDAFTPAMDEYADQDPVVTAALFDRIDAKNYSQECLDLENEVAQIIFLQEEHGFLFDVERAEQLAVDLTARKAELEDTLRETFKPWYVPKRYKGAHDVLTPKTDNRKQGYVKGCPLTKVELVVFNPASRDHIADRMIKLFGWRPVEFTETGKPKVDETTLAGIDSPEARLLVEYLTVDKRLGQIAAGDQAWLKKVRADQRIHGSVNSNGAVTGRMTHSNPNVAQVPSVKVGKDGKPLLGYEGGWGFESRSCFIVAPGYLLVGCDAEGLELRMLGHYMARFDGGSYADTVVNGKKEDGTDVHTVNMRVVGLNSRNNAKTFIYAYLYGAGNFKLGTIVLDDKDETDRSAFFARYPAGEKRDKAIVRLGLRARRRIEEGLPALGKLQELVKAKAKRGFLKGLDGRLLHVRSQHSALNTLLQGGGAIVMKKALVLCYREFLSRGWRHGQEFAFVANVHDEFQKEVQEALAETAGKIAAWSIQQAGEVYGLRCPLAGAYQIGHSWADSH
ncbi:MAG: DNA polymerase [Phenylobacterium sp.]|uniref:DNA polymerase n=1 Tax=Phenylobacterium sp. TaxID=1871053 RepID=UPI00391C47C5